MLNYWITMQTMIWTWFLRRRRTTWADATSDRWTMKTALTILRWTWRCRLRFPMTWITWRNTRIRFGARHFRPIAIRRFTRLGRSNRKWTKRPRSFGHRRRSARPKITFTVKISGRAGTFSSQHPRQCPPPVHQVPSDYRSMQSSARNFRETNRRHRALKSRMTWNDFRCHRFGLRCVDRKLWKTWTMVMQLKRQAQTPSTTMNFFRFLFFFFCFCLILFVQLQTFHFVYLITQLFPGDLQHELRHFIDVGPRTSAERKRTQEQQEEQVRITAISTKVSRNLSPITLQVRRASQLELN